MRTFATAVGLMILWGCSAWAQTVPNAGFETWTNGVPNDWTTSNAPPVLVNVTKSTTAHTGSASARGDVVNIGGPVNLQPVLQSGAAGQGFAIASRPAAITGWYQFTSVGSDRFGINVVLFKGGADGTPVANAALADPASRGAWYQFNVPFVYLSAEIPDVCIIQHQIISPTTGSNPSVGSFFLLDDLAFSGTSDVEPIGTTPASFALHQNFPNPFNPSTMISFDLPAAGNVHLTVFDMLGRQVSTLVEERRAAGRHDVTFNAAGLPSGTYLVRFQADGYTQTRSMLLVK